MVEVEEVGFGEVEMVSDDVGGGDGLKLVELVPGAELELVNVEDEPGDGAPTLFEDDPALELAEEDNELDRVDDDTDIKVGPLGPDEEARVKDADADMNPVADVLEVLPELRVGTELGP